MDFYAFKSEFQKLVELTVQKKYWANYLKHNYLTGSAFTLVEKESDYSKIWDRLFESFGNTRLLLQNKLGNLDTNWDNLDTNWVIWTYEGGGLENIMTLIGVYRQII